MTDISKVIIKLISNAIFQKESTITEEVDWEEVYHFAKKQQITVLIYYGLRNAKTDISKEIMSKFEMDAFMHSAISCNQLYEIKRIADFFEEKGIDHMLLKGSVIKAAYPKPEMRQMSDSDILIKTEQYEKISSAMCELGYEYKYDSDHEIVWHKKPNINIELHKRLIPSYNKDFYSYYGEGWNHAQIISGKNYSYEMNEADNYIYIFTHFAKHYRDAGVGVKHMIDLYVLKKNADTEYVKNELSKLKLYDFYQAVAKTLKVWLEDESGDIQTETITKRIFSGGAYGTAEARTLSSAVKATKSGKTAKSTARNKRIKMLFPSLETLKENYLILEKAPVLLPAIWIWRWITALLFRRDNIKIQSATAKTLSEKKIASYQDELDIVGLDFNFKE